VAEPAEPAVRVLIADDHPIFRDGLATLLDPLPGIDVVGRAQDGIEAVELALDRRPDVVIMDIQMPRLNGIEATRQIVAAEPSIGILVITMGEDDSTVFAAVRAGARGYLLKGADQAEIVRAITTVHGGGVVFGASLANRIANVFTQAPAPQQSAFPQLTDREREVLNLIAAGRSNGQIASALFLSPKTVRNNVSTILSKLQATDRAAMIIQARDAGLGT
jgi:DNA-binding NarL/FixJ family response regulator